MKKIEVLWIDDESKTEEYRYYIVSAVKEDIILNPIEFEDDGVNELDNYYSKYDAIILDVRTKKSQGASEMQNHQDLLERINRIMNKRGRHEKPVFIFSGQTGAGEDGSYLHQHYENTIKYNLYIKQKEEDKLWKDIRSRVLNETAFKIKQKHAEVLECAKLYNDKIYSRLLTLVFHIEGYMLIDNLWAEMRSLLDDLINTVVEKNNSDLFKKYLINQDDGRVMLGNASFFLEGTYRAFKDDSSEREDPITHEDHWDKYMTDLMRNFIPILQALNHSVNEELTINNERRKAVWEKQRGNRNLERSVVYQLFVLVEYIANRYYKNS
jgi:hypothetical protein